MGWGVELGEEMFWGMGRRVIACRERKISFFFFFVSSGFSCQNSWLFFGDNIRERTEKRISARFTC